MLIFLYLVFLCSNFLFIKCDDSNNVRIDVIPGHNCTLGANYTFTEGQQVTLNVTPTKHINYGWWQIIDVDGTKNVSDNLKTNGLENADKIEPTIHTEIIKKNMSGKWEFKFLLLRENHEVFQTDPKVEKTTYPDGNNGELFIVSRCSTNVEIVPPPAAAATNKGTPVNKTLIIACVVGAILMVIIVAQTAYIMFLKAKAQKLINMNTHNNLSKRSDSVPDDTARYCSNPGQKMMKEPSPVYEDNRDSVIYEAPNIEIPSNNSRMPMQPPQPPAITTMPRTPRADHNMRIGPQAMLASTLNSPARSPPMPENFPPNFQRFTQNDRDLSVANRPRLPLPNTLHDTPLTIPKHNPHEHMFQEVYEEMEPIEENTYEPPPVINAMPPRLPMPPKKVPTGNLLDVKENTLKLRQGNKPPVTPKPARPRSNIMIPPNELNEYRKRNDTMPKPTMTPMQQELAMRRRPNEAQTNELEDVLRRRNTADNAKLNRFNRIVGHVERMSESRLTKDAQKTNELEDVLRRRNNAVKNVPIVSIPDSSSRETQKPRPPPSKPKGQTIPHPVQEEIYYNENQASSDEEWTYEPLKPLNTVMQTPLASIPDPTPSKPRPPPSKPMGQQIPHPVQEGPPLSKPRGPPTTQPIQEEIYYNPNDASSDEEWIYEPLKPSHSYDNNL